MSGESPFSRRLEAAAVPVEGIERRIEASEAERAGIVAEFGLLGLTRLEADLVISRFKRDGIRVEGRIVADLVQACVVTLDPVPQAIDEDFMVRLVPLGSDLAPPAARPDQEVLISMEDDDPPDLYEGGMIDLGAIVTEQFLLALDPYPRAPGAELPAETAPEEDEEAPPSPFAVLGKLKPGKDGKP